MKRKNLGTALKNRAPNFDPITTKTFGGEKPGVSTLKKNLYGQQHQNGHGDKQKLKQQQKNFMNNPIKKKEIV